MLTATAIGFFEDELDRSRARAVPAADHLERRQLGLAGLDAGDPRDGARRGPRRGLVAACCGASSLIGLALGALLGVVRVAARAALGRRGRTLRRRTTC